MHKDITLFMQVLTMLPQRNADSKHPIHHQASEPRALQLENHTILLHILLYLWKDLTELVCFHEIKFHLVSRLMRLKIPKIKRPGF